MQTHNLYLLALQLRDRMFKPTCSMFCERVDWRSSLSGIIDELEYAISDTWKDDKKVDKEVERGLKHGLYRLRTLVDEAVMVKLDFDDPESSLPYISSVDRELELIRHELQPCSGSHHWLVTESVGCRGYKCETEKLIDLLVDPDAGPIIPILGKSGVGKSIFLSIISELAFDDPRVKQQFIDTDHIVPLNYMNVPYLGLDSLVEVLDREDVRGKNMLITIDNVHRDMLKDLSENKDQDSYKDLVKRVDQGSKIVITSRLEPEEIGTHISPQVLCLSGLSSSESWSLFKRTAFSDEENLKKKLSTLADLGHQILEKCENVPGVIVIIATILSSKNSPEEWKHFLDVVMTSVPDPITTVTYVLQRISIADRSFPYKQRVEYRLSQEEWYCNFAWCSLLPKDYTFTKNDLLDLWMAHTTTTTTTLTPVPLKTLLGGGVRKDQIARYMHKKRNQDAKKNVERWFDDFVMNGYFIECDGAGTTVRYKTSSLGYELMKHVAGDDYCLVDDPAVEIYHKDVRHISFIVDVSWEPPSWLPCIEFLQSLWLWPRKSGDFLSLSKINSTLSHMRHLRALHAEVVHCERIPQFLGEFKQLKYVRLGVVSTISLPDDIPALQKVLNYEPYYSSLIDDKRPAQAILDLLVSFTSKKFTIQPKKDNIPDSLEEAQHFMQSLNVQSIILSSFHEENEKLKSTNLHQTVEILKVHLWAGEKWPIDDLSILAYNLVSIEFRDCRRCQHFPAFSRLPRLSSLCIWGMCSLEEILIRDEIHEKSEASSTRTLYPSLKILKLLYLPKFKGWSHKEGDCFPLLAHVRIKGCPNLMSMPSVPMLKSLEAINIDTKLMKHLIYPHVSTLSTASSNPMSNYVSSPESTPSPNKEICRASSCLHSLKLDSIQLVSLPNYLESITTLKQLSLCWLTSLKALPEWITKLRRLTLHYCLKLRTLPNSYLGLEQLDIRYCPRLTHFPESLPNLKILRVKEICRFEQILQASQNLEELEVDNCQDWEYDTQSTEGNSSVSVWKGHSKLRSFSMTKMEEFPKSIDFKQLSDLCRLTIKSCPRLTQLPQELKNL